MSIIRRRGLLEEAEGGSPYPYESNYPEFNEYGAWRLTPVEGTATTNTNSFIKSGATAYTYCGGSARNSVLLLTIDPDTAKITVQYRRADNTGWAKWLTKNFVDFPVLFKRCSGAEANAAGVTFIVTKEE